MTYLVCLFLAVMSIWDYPARQQQHDVLSRHFIVAFKEGNTQAMAEICRRGIAVLPEDPTWHYNYACSLAYYPTKTQEALDELQKAIDLGFRNIQQLENDTDLMRLKGNARYDEILEDAKSRATRPVFTGPGAFIPLYAASGETISLSAPNLTWNLDRGCFEAHIQMNVRRDQPYSGCLYMNRDGGHSVLTVTNYVGLSRVILDSEGRQKGADLDMPNMAFNFPVFGNCSRALTVGPYWRSLPRMMTTNGSAALMRLYSFYRTNQFWVFPAVDDVPPMGKKGDLFASVTPYWVTTAGRSWSDLPYVRAGLKAYGAFRPEVRAELIRSGRLAPTLQKLIRLSQRGVTNEVNYLTARAHPTAFPQNGIDQETLKRSAEALTVEAIPPVVTLQSVEGDTIERDASWPELTYATPCAWAWILRDERPLRIFTIQAAGAEKYEFRVVHGNAEAVSFIPLGKDKMRVKIRREGLTQGNRIDLAVFGKNAKTGWSAPAFVSFAVVDPEAEYADPVITPLTPERVKAMAPADPPPRVPAPQVPQQKPAPSASAAQLETRT